MKKETMRFISHVRPGGPEELQYGATAVPSPTSDEVLIKVAAAGVNRPDIAQRQGHYPPPPGASAILGLEVAGEIVAVGKHVNSWSIGDRVCALTNGGGYAEYACAPQGQCLPWPKDYDATLAAALPETFFTVWANLFQLGRLVSGESVLVHGGSSGIGVTAIQLARERGATCYVTAGSDEKCARCIELGAAAAINYRREDFAARISELTDAAGVDVVLDMVGAPYFHKNIAALKMDGRLIQIAFLQGSVVESFDLGIVMRRRLLITGSTMRPRSAADKAAIARALQAEVWPVLDGGRCKPVIHAVFALQDAADAHRVLESSAHIGKIILRVGN